MTKRTIQVPDPSSSLTLPRYLKDSSISSAVFHAWTHDHLWVDRVNDVFRRRGMRPEFELVIRRESAGYEIRCAVDPLLGPPPETPSAAEDDEHYSETNAACELVRDTKAWTRERGEWEYIYFPGALANAARSIDYAFHGRRRFGIDDRVQGSPQYAFGPKFSPYQPRGPWRPVHDPYARTLSAEMTLEDSVCRYSFYDALTRMLYHLADVDLHTLSVEYAKSTIEARQKVS